MTADPSQKGHNDRRPLTPGWKGRIVRCWSRRECHASVPRGRSRLVARVRQHAPDLCGGEIDGKHHRCREGDCGPAARRSFRASAKRQNRRRGGDDDDQRHRQLCRPESRSGQLRGRDRRHRRKDCRHERDCHCRRGRHCIVGCNGSVDRARRRREQGPSSLFSSPQVPPRSSASSWPTLETTPAPPNSSGRVHVGGCPDPAHLEVVKQS